MIYASSVMTPLRLSGAMSEASLLKRVTNGPSIGIETDPGTIFKLVGFMYAKMGMFQESDTLVIIGSGRRSSIIFELCFFGTVRVIGLEIEKKVHAESNRIIEQLVSKVSGFTPKLYNERVDATDVDIQGSKAVYRFHGHGEPDEIDVKVFRTESVQVYCCTHIKNLKNLGLSKEEQEEWELVILRQARQENTQYILFLYFRLPRSDKLPRASKCNG